LLIFLLTEARDVIGLPKTVAPAISDNWFKNVLRCLFIGCEDED
jgi:hypothetical protein